MCRFFVELHAFDRPAAVFQNDNSARAAERLSINWTYQLYKQDYTS